jgi:hypothetical protein
VAEFAVTPITRRVLDGIDRLLRGKPVRVATLQMGGRPVDLARTSAIDPPGGTKEERRRLAQLLWDPYEQSRPQRYAEYREIADEVPELWRGLNVLHSFIFSGFEVGDRLRSFALSMAKDARPEVRRAVADAEMRLDLHRKIRKKTLEGLWLGDHFDEIVFDTSSAQRLRFMQPERVMAIGDDRGGIDYFLYRGQGVTVRDGTPLHPFQVWAYNPDAPDGSRYGRSLFVAGRRRRRLHEAVLDILGVLAIKKAKGDERILWPFSGEAQDDEIWGFVHQVQAELDEVYFDDAGDMRRRAAAQVDFAPSVVPYRVIDNTTVRPEIVQTSAADLGQLVTVSEHLQQMYFICLGVPASFVGLDRDSRAKATAGVQGLAFALQVAARQREAAELVADVLDRCLLVAGYVPEPGEVAVSMARPAQFDEQIRAEVVNSRATAAASLVTAGFPVLFVAKYALGLSEEDATQIAEAARVQAQAQGIPVAGESGWGATPDAQDLLRRAAEAANHPELEPVTVDLAERVPLQPERPAPPPGG